MLADEGEPRVQSGGITAGILLTGASLLRLIDFIAGELPLWRDRPDRKPVESETALTSQLCAHMNSAARRSRWDFLQFRTEEPDEVVAGRKIDLVPAPSDATVWVDGRRHVDFDPLIPIECKRLPTPTGTSRDKREYLFSRHSSTGGVARFKAGHHGAGHALGAMIGYVQAGSVSQWHAKLGHWVGALSRAKMAGWSSADMLLLDREDCAARFALLRSQHARQGALAAIDLRHLWIEMG
ncbi:MAG: hypothetical protein H2049_01740 [Porphyrobacter sp.]|nr:hypothetical protein [Porphyrobacter sp.]